MKEKLQAAQAAASGFRLRSFVGKMVSLRDEGNVYGEKLAPEKLEEILDELIDVEFVRNSILEGARAGPVSAKELAERIGANAARVLREIVVLRRKNLLELDRIEGETPLYRAAGVSGSAEA